jgi:hypothetical protein
MSLMVQIAGGIFIAGFAALILLALGVGLWFLRGMMKESR